MGMYLQPKSPTQSSKISLEFEDLLIRFKEFLDEIQDIGRINRNFINEDRIVRDTEVNVLIKVVQISSVVNSILRTNGNLGGSLNCYLLQSFENLISKEIKDCLEENRIISSKENIKYEIKKFMLIDTDSHEYRMFRGKTIDDYLVWKKFVKINEKISNIYAMFQTLDNNIK